MKASSTGQITRNFRRTPPPSHWSVRMEKSLSESDSDGSDYYYDEEWEDSDDDDEEEDSEDDDEEEEDSDEEDSSITCTKYLAKHEVECLTQAIFELSSLFVFKRWVCSSNMYCYLVEGNEVVKISKRRSPARGAPKEIRCMTMCREVEGVLQARDWYTLRDGQYATVTPLTRNDPFRTLFGNMAEIQSYMRQLLTMLEGCRVAGVMHRDVKPSNVFWNSSTGKATLTDFDCSTMYPDKDRFGRGVGTHGFMSPEMEGMWGYTWKSDIYSAGVVFGMALHNDQDERGLGENVKQWVRKRRRGRKGASIPYYGDSSSKNLLRKMLNFNPNERPTYVECLEHEFFSMKYE